MKILYTPVGDTDPIRGCYDGGILHIIRYYHPDKVVAFLTDDMRKKEETRQIYSKAIKNLAPSIELEFIKTDIKEAHRMEALLPLVEGFVKLKKSYADAEFILNLSSGTPQMKSIMTFLATDFPDVRAVQVDSPKKGSNRDNSATQDSEDVDILIEMNLDNEENAANRCSEPPLRMLKRYSIRYKLVSLIESFEYENAWRLYQDSKDMFSEYTGKLLQHLVYREMLKTRDALQIIDKIGEFNLRGHVNNEVSKLNEFFMVMELRQKQKKIPDFIVKITPFLYHLAKYYLVNRMHTALDKMGDVGKNGSIRLRRGKLYENYPKCLERLDSALFPELRDGTALSFNNIIIMLSAYPQCDNNLLELFKELRQVEENQRNYIAHTIISISENDLSKIEPKLNSEQILKKLRKAFNLVMVGEKISQDNIYEQINEYVKESLNEYK